MDKANYKTSEFITTVIYLLGMIFSSFIMQDLTKWAISVTIVVSSYIVSRSIYKAYRAILLERKQSEIIAYIIGQSLLLYSAFMNKISMELCVLMISIIQASYSIGRGYAKSLQSQQTKTMVIR